MSGASTATNRRYNRVNGMNFDEFEINDQKDAVKMNDQEEDLMVLNLTKNTF